MLKTEWTIRKASDSRYEEKQMVYGSITFAGIVQELYEKYGYDIIIDMQNHIFVIYDDYIE